MAARMHYLEQVNAREWASIRAKQRTIRNLVRLMRRRILGPQKRTGQSGAADQGYRKFVSQRLLQISPKTGQFLALLAANAPEGVYLEIGTSAGYSTLWIALACEMLGRSITTFELVPEKIDLARETFRLAQVEGTVNLVEGDARHYLSQYENVAFCFLDADKRIYGECYEMIVPRLVKGGLLVADNVIGHRRTLQPMVDRALADGRVDALIVPVGDGELLCRRI
jgi:predicted O-methyltransferase YrrM